MDRLPNIHLLLAFVTVVREGGVSAAADILNLTQPAVSHQIKRLSEETGITLFRRTSSGLQLTQEGAALVSKAERVLEAAADFRGSARLHTGRVSGKLRLGTIVDPEFIRLGRLLRGLCQDYPDIETELVHGVSGETLSRIKRNQIDAGYYLGSIDEIDLLNEDEDEPVFAKRLADFRYLVIGPAGWQNQIGQAAWPELAALPWIGTPEASAHHRLLSGVFERHNCFPSVVAKVDQEASMLEMVRSGIGLSLCRESIALSQKQASGLAVCHSVDVPACLSFLFPSKQTDGPVLRALTTVLRDVW